MSENDQLTKRLETNHPVYDGMASSWKEIRDVLFDRVGMHLEDYLPRGEFEDDRPYEIRKRLSRFKADTPGLISRLVSAVFSESPNRPKSIVSQFKDLIENCDGCKTHMNDFMEERLFYALGFGVWFILIDRPKADNGVVRETTSKDFQIVETDRVVSDSDTVFVPYEADEVTNWSVDRCGEFNWIRTKENELRQISPDDDADTVTVYREWDRTAWRIYEVRHDKGKKVAVEIGQGNHNLGIVPLVPVWLHREGLMRFISTSRFAYHYDIQKFQDESDLRYDTFMHAHPTLKRKADREQAKSLVVGSNAVIDLDPRQEEDVEYLKYPSEATDQLRKNIDSHLESQRRVLGLDPLGTMETSQAFRASGTARRTSFNVTEARHLNRFARRLQVAEQRVWEIVARWNDPNPERLPSERLVNETTAYARVFTSSSPEAMIESWQETRVGINSDTFDRELQRKIVVALVPDISSEKMDEILNQIESNPILGKNPQAGVVPFNENTADEVTDAITEFDNLRITDVSERSRSQPTRDA